MRRQQTARRIRRLAVTLLITAFASITCRAQTYGPSEERESVRQPVLHHIGHYIRTHKFPIIVDSFAVLANAADASSTLRAARYCPTCQDDALGRNPTPAKTWFELMGASALLVTFNHVAYHHYRAGGSDPDWVGQHFFVLVFSIPIVVHGIADVQENAETGPHDPHDTELARRGLMTTSQ
jgi:hypothetical protein